MQFDAKAFEVADLENFVPQQAQEKEFARIKAMDWDRYWEYGFAITGVIEHETACFGGVLEVCPGVGECWMFLSNKCSHAEMIYLVRGIKRVVDRELENNLHRVQMYVDTSFQPGIRLAKILGMRQEGLLEHYPSKGIDSFLFART